MLTIEVLIGTLEGWNPQDYFLKAKELFELSKQDATIKVCPDREHSYLRDKIMAKHIDKKKVTSKRRIMIKSIIAKENTNSIT